MSNNNENKNLQNIQRIDTNACEIILQCTQAAYYEFDLMENNWKTKRSSRAVVCLQTFGLSALRNYDRQPPVVGGLCSTN
uniref:Uncharacterized protein n=1 Tax=Meloidogyne enterolobii TaxID=390850 RepID=A0A6V7X6U9_MELEN|nr:unnamed protein product [Meloidogyne enterolobii]